MSPKIALSLFIFTLSSLSAIASDPDPVHDYCIPNPKFGFSRGTRLPIHPCKNTSEITTDDFVFSGMNHVGEFTDTGLAAISVNPSIFPGLHTLGMSFARADLEVDGVNPPHIHPRATEIAYIIRGSVYTGFVDSENRVFAKVIKQGEVIVYPRGLVHFQMNVGDEPATIFGSFNSQNPGNLKIPAAVFGSGIKEELLEKAFGLSTSQIGTMKRKFRPKKV